VIGDPAAAGASPVTIRHVLRLRIPDVADATILAVASIIVVQITAAASLGITRGQRQGRRLTGQIAPVRVLQRCLLAIRASLDADRMVRIGYAMHLHRSARKLYLGLDSLLMPPRQDTEGHVCVFLNVYTQFTPIRLAATTASQREVLLHSVRREKADII